MSRETNDVGVINFDAAGVIPLGTLVKLDSAGTVSVAAAGDLVQVQLDR